MNDTFLEPGARILYMDGEGKEHNALVTQVFEGNVVNLLFVGAELEDSFGKQARRGLSIPHVLNSQGTGNFWCWPGEGEDK